MDKNVLIKLIDDRKSIREIAEVVGKSFTTTKYWINKFGLKTRPVIGKKGTILSQEMKDRLSKIKKEQYISRGLNYKGSNNPHFGKAGNNQFSKAKELGLEIPKFSKETLEKIRISNTGKIHTELTKATISNGMRKAIREGRYTPPKNANRCKRFHYTNWLGEDVILQGSWELKLAKFFDEIKIYWTINKKPFPYIFENKERSYFPDFLLTKLNTYVEVKGYETERDHAKWKCFPHKLLIVRRNELKNLKEWSIVNNIHP